MTDSMLGPYTLGFNDTDECGIYTGDARELAKAIPDESVDLIFTDPIYDRIEDYRWLAETAARVLRADGSLLVFCGIGYIPETHDALRVPGLSYRWRLVVRPVNAKQFSGRLLITSQEVLWYERNGGKLYAPVFDVQMSTKKGNYARNGGNWGKGIDALARYVMAFTNSTSVILDPFSGSGSISAEAKTQGRNYLAFEIEPDVADMARDRVRNTQPPLFVSGPESTQLELLT